MACEYPITIANPAARLDESAAKSIPVPCRKCPACLAKRSNGWIFRLLQHDKVAGTALFVTLTYDNDHVPLTEKGYMTLKKRDFQLFMKRVRKRSPKPRKRAVGEPESRTDRATAIKYFAVGEYGSTTYRPHYHAIIFNTPVDIIEKCWGLGSVHCDLVNGSTVAYTTKYMHKGKLIPVHSNDDRIPEFQLLSKGLGLDYISESITAWHRADLKRLYVVVEDGIKVPMPALYRSKIFTDAQRKTQAHLVQSTLGDLLDRQMADYKRVHGSTEFFYRDQVESKHAALAAFRERQRSRNKI